MGSSLDRSEIFIAQPPKQALAPEERHVCFAPKGAWKNVECRGYKHCAPNGAVRGAYVFFLASLVLTSSYRLCWRAPILNHLLLIKCQLNQIAGSAAWPQRRNSFIP